MKNIISLFKDFFETGWLNSWKPYLLIFIIGFLLYSQTLSFDFTYFDDNALILEKTEILSSWHNLGNIFSNDAFFSNSKFYYRPILNLSFMMDYQFAGVNPFFYHLSNILLHLISTFLVFLFLAKLIKNKSLSFLLTLFFLVHPVLAQAVAWLPGRNDSLLTIFVLAAFVALINFWERGKLKHFIFHLLFLFLAPLTKETAVMVVPLGIFYVFFLNNKKNQKNEILLIILGSLTMCFIWFLMRSLSLGQEPINYFQAIISIINNSAALVIDIGKLIIPVGLSVLPILEDSSLIFGLIVLPILIILLLFSRQRRNNYLFFGLLWFIIFLVPSFIQLNDLPDFLEHRLYLPLVGFLIVIAEIDWIKNLRFNLRNKVLLVLLLFILMLATYNHSSNFRDRLTFWHKAVEGSPHSPLAWRNLGVMHYFNDDLELAEKYYRQSLSLNDQEPMVHNNLGVIYLKTGDYGAAEQEFKEELAINPQYDKALFNLGDLYYRQKRWAESQKFLQETLRVNPGYYEAQEHLLILENQLR